MKTTNIRKLLRRGLEGNQPFNVRYVRKVRAVERTNALGDTYIAYYEPTPEIARVEVVHTAGEIRARLLGRHHAARKKARQLRRAGRAGRAAKR